MTETSPTKTLRDEVDALRERVERLEQLLNEDDESPSRDRVGVADHRDAAVLDAVVERDAEPSALETVRLYKRLTDIANTDTAKQRAKNIRGTDAWTEAVER